MKSHLLNGAPGLAQDLRHMVDETEQLLRATASSGDQAFDAVREKFAVQVRQMQAQLDELDQVGRARARQIARSADESVHAHPYGAMGMAAAAGLLVGMLVARR